MKFIQFYLVMILACCSVSSKINAQETDQAQPFEQWLLDQDKHNTAPFQIFDNIYYVGTRWVSAYLIKTSAGLILIDSLFGPYVEQIPGHIRQLGFNPADLKYIIVTHGHFDHAGGAHYLQQHFGSQTVMTETAYEVAEQLKESSHPVYQFIPPQRNVIAKDNMTLTLGDTTIRFYSTPGHTRGSLSLELSARDGAEQYRAFVIGGMGPFFTDEAQAQTYFHSFDRIRELAQSNPPVAVNLANHPDYNQLFARKKLLKEKRAVHPFVDPAGFIELLDSLNDQAQKKHAKMMANQ